MKKKLVTLLIIMQTLSTAVTETSTEDDSKNNCTQSEASRLACNQERYHRWNVPNDTEFDRQWSLLQAKRIDADDSKKMARRLHCLLSGLIDCHEHVKHVDCIPPASAAWIDNKRRELVERTNAGRPICDQKARWIVESLSLGLVLAIVLGFSTAVSLIAWLYYCYAYSEDGNPLNMNMSSIPSRKSWSALDTSGKADSSAIDS